MLYYTNNARARDRLEPKSTESALDNPVDLDDIGKWDGPANEISYYMVWNDGNQGD
jgi:hypothetical protein